MYLDLLADYAYTRQPYIRLQYQDTKDNNVTETAKMLWLSQLVGGNFADEMQNYLRDYVTDEDKIVVDLAKIEYWKTKLASAPLDKTVINLSTGSETQKIDLSNTGGLWQKLTQTQAQKLKVTTLSGTAELKWEYYVGREGLVKTRPDSAVGLARSFRKAKGVGPITPGDLVEVKLTYNFANNAPPCGYQVIDNLPSGLAYINNPGDYGLTSHGWAQETGGQTIKFGVCNSYWWLQHYGKTIVYYGRAVSPGQFVAEPAVIQYETDPQIYAKTREETITIERQK
jgi:uncharacterized protein YfaS (alpha-2-macroglobulin family)